MKKKEKEKFYRVNERIKFSPVMVIDVDGEKLGTMPVKEAQKKAREAGLDLVEVAARARPPVCRIMDFGKFRYEQSIKEKKQRKKSKANQSKEVRFRPDIADHDLNTKINSVRKFLEAGHKVHLKLQYLGRQNAHKDLGFKVIERVVEALAEESKVVDKPTLQGRFLNCTLEPLK